MDIQTITDRTQITDLLALYCRGVDRRDEATLRAIYHNDATEDRGEELFIGPAQEWVGWALGALQIFSLTQHCIHNSLIDLEGDTAYGETYFTAYHRFGPGQENTSSNPPAALIPVEVTWPQEKTELILAGRYLDRFERRNGTWKIAYRRTVCDWCRTQPVADYWTRDNPTAPRGVADISDARL